LPVPFRSTRTWHEEFFLVPAWSAVAGLAIAPTPPPYRSEQAAGHHAHDLFGQSPGKKSWIIIGLLLEYGSPPLIVASHMDLWESIRSFVKGILDSLMEEELDASSRLMVDAHDALIHEHTKT
jgi:hypothetical protein